MTRNLRTHFIMTDLKYAWRQLLRNPGFTGVAILTLALGVGAATAVFSVVNAVLLRPLPYPDSDRLVRLYSEFPNFPQGGLRRFAVSVPEYFDLKQETKSWESLEAWATGGVNLAGAGQPTRATAAAVTGGMFSSLGIPPLLGRTLTPADDAPGGASVAVISYGLWQRFLGADPAVVGQNILLNGTRCTILGVMPRDFEFPPGATDPTELWAPLGLDPANPGGRADHSLSLLGRLRTGVTREQAQAELESLAHHWGETSSGHRFDDTKHTLVSYGLHEEVVRSVRPAMRMLLGAVGFLLLISCVNVANLLLARAESRQREIAIRGALGAGRARLIRQFAIEGLLLSSAGVLFGCLIAFGSLEILKSASYASIPRASEIAVDGRVIGFAAAVCLLTGIGFGLTPLVHVLRRSLNPALRVSAGSAGGTAGTQHFRQVLVVGELALALCLLIGTGLMLRGFWKLQEVPAGFDSQNVTTMTVALPESRYGRPEVLEFWRSLDERLSALPGLESVAMATGLPPSYSSSHSDTQIEDFVPRDGGPIQNVEFYQVVSPGYFRTLRIPLLEGRLFDGRDGPQAPEVAVINQTMARTFWGNRSAVGRRIRPSGTTNWCTVIGVVADTKNGGLDKPTGTEIYLPFTQPAGQNRSQRMSLLIRTPSNTPAVVNVVRGEVARLDPGLPLSRVRTLEDLVAAAQSRPRYFTLLFTVFAAVALALAAVGIYGVISYSVSRQSKEFGLRMALGARRDHVLGIVLRRGLKLTLVGMVVGLLSALALTRLLSSLLFGITPTDPATFVTVSLLMAAVAFLATYLPARRATLVDPADVLRAEG